jgi:hypothetical protein
MCTYEALMAKGRANNNNKDCDKESGNPNDHM